MAQTKSQKAAAARRAAKQVAERVRLGEDAYAVKHQVGKSAWRHIVNDAHAKGFTVPSYLSNAPDELKARTHSSLKTQATTLVNEAFAPRTKELDYQGQQAANIRQKRLDDASSYNQWLTQEMSKSAAAAQTAQQNYTDFVDKQSGAAKQAAEQLLAQANAQSSQGISGDMQGSAAMTNLRGQLQAQAQGADNQAAAAHAAEPMAQERGAAIQASVQGMYAARAQGIEGDYGKANSEINSNRLKLDTDRATAVISGYTDLLNKEIDKANANRDYSGLMAQLNEKSAAREQEHQEFIMGQKTTRRGQTISSKTSIENNKRTTSATERGQTLSHQDKVADRRQRASENRLDRAQRDALAATKLAAADKTNTLKVSQANQKITAVIDTIADILRTQQRGKAGKSGSGYLWDSNEQKWRPARQVLINRGATTAQINAGLAHARGQLLTPQQKAAVGILG